MIKNKKDDFHVYITENTFRGVMLEKARHPGMECIIQMPGRRVGNKFYYDMVADSGIQATYKYAMCEKDHKYCDHLSSMIASYYDFPYEELVIAQIHFHPAQYKHFSRGDGPANTKLAQQFGGVTNGLMWVDPEFHMQFWYIDERGKETKVAYTIDDEAVEAVMPKKSLEKLKKMVEDQEKGKRISTKIPALGKCCLEEEKKMEEKFEDICQSYRLYKVLLPREYQTMKYIGKLRGYYIPETKTFNVVTNALVEARSDTQIIGEVYQEKTAFETEGKETPFIQMVWTEEGAEIQVLGEDNEEVEVGVDYYSLKSELFSRNKGILEANQMSDKQAIIGGVGSGGFFVGLELVKAGIGSLIVMDDDTFAYHNICRHVCGMHDVGRFKVDLFKERAADINPDCKVYTFRDLIQHVDPKALEELVWTKSIILCCADNRHSAYICNELADKFQIPMIAAGCGAAASTGEVFYYKPGGEMPCYTCAYGDDIGVNHSNQKVRRKFYATETELEKLHFQPGMSLDIEMTAIFQAKLAIDLLMESESGYQAKLLPYINQCTVLLNYPVDKEVNPYMQLFENSGSSLRPMTWKSGPAAKNIACTYCSSKE